MKKEQKGRENFGLNRGFDKSINVPIKHKHRFEQVGKEAVRIFCQTALFPKKTNDPNRKADKVVEPGIDSSRELLGMISLLRYFTLYSSDSVIQRTSFIASLK